MESIDPKRPQGSGMTPMIAAAAFSVASLLLVARTSWAFPWALSGAPLLTCSLIVAGERRVLSFIPLWPLTILINAVYALASTSWLFRWVFAAVCYPTIFLTGLFHFTFVSNFARRNLRKVLRDLHFISDKISFFDLPALEIDRDVDGLLVIRGVTISLSNLTVFVHGVEVGIKFSDDLELALVVDLVTIKLFRRIEVGEVYGNVKGGAHEMSFHELAPNTRDEQGQPMMDQNILDQDTPLLRAAGSRQDDGSEKEQVRMVDEMTDNQPPSDKSAEGAVKEIKHVALGDEQASNRYSEILSQIEKTSSVHQAREKCKRNVEEAHETNVDLEDRKAMRAAVCTVLHNMPSVPHPPKHSIKVTTLQNLSSPGMRKFMHRLPLLLRLLLNPAAYFHPVFIESITAGASGGWALSMIEQKVFGTTENADIKHLQRRISSWLSDANFCVELADIKGTAQVPVNTDYDILSMLKFDDVLVYRAEPQTVMLKEVVRLGGADATVAVPSFLLPHHEHILPARPTTDQVMEKVKTRNEADGKPKTVQAQQEVERSKKDETNIILSTHVRLPACFDQQLLDFIAALVKATKLVEFDKEADKDADELAEQQSRSSFREFTHAAKESMKTGFKKATVDAIANDRWIAKVVGKVMKKLETAQGDFGYSGNLPVALEVYRQNAEPYSKLLP